MAFLYALRFADGSDAGEYESLFDGVRAGDVIIPTGRPELRVLSVIPTGLAGDFVDRPIYGVLEVEPV
jgi:hypothetical protein